MRSYEDFVLSKAVTCQSAGINVERSAVDARLFEFQKDCLLWALRRGRAALFQDCGLGKSFQQLDWSRIVAAHTQGKILILAPLAVAQQTVREGAKFGIPVGYAKNASEIKEAITITNYERLDSFDPGEFAGVVLDESSVLKAYDGKTRTQIIESFKQTPFRLACTATPAPNDFMELGNHAEFLGAMTRAEMLSMFFVHDGGSTQDWRVKGHAEDAFWRWICSWAVMLRKPSDLGYDDGAFTLPPLEMHEHVIAADHRTAHRSGMLFKMEALTLDEQRKARRGTLDDRVAKCAELVNASDEPWIVWCELNDEGDALEAAIHGAVQVAGSDDPDVKIARALDFVVGNSRVMVSKSSIFGYGLNFQHCRNMAFVGVSHSFEQFYQAVRREWRFGQTRTVNCHIITSELEGRVVANLQRKERDAAKMAAAMLVHMRDIQQVNVRGTVRNVTEYEPGMPMRLPAWLKTESEAA